MRARRGEVVTVRVSGDEPLRRARLLFTERADSLVLSTPTVATARFASARDGDEDWLLLDAAEPGAALRLEVSVDGRPAAAGFVRAGAATLDGEGPWTLEPGAVERADAPPALDGVSLWRAPGGATNAKHVDIPARVREALRHAGYAE